MKANIKLAAVGTALGLTLFTTLLHGTGTTEPTVAPAPETAAVEIPTPLAQVAEVDPYFQQLKQQEKDHPEMLGRALPETAKSTHLWKVALPANLPTGEHTISVQTEDMYGRVFNASRSLRVR